MSGYLSQLVNVQIAGSGASPTVQQFSVPMIVAYHSHYTDRVRSYTSLAALAADGFASWEPAYQMASDLLEASPSVTQFKVGRRASAFMQKLQLAVPSAPGAVGTVYGLQLMTIPTVTGTATFPLNVTAGETLVVWVNGGPNVTGGSTQTLTFTGTQGHYTSAGESFASGVANTDTISLTINSGSPFTVTWAGSETTAAAFAATLQTYFTAHSEPATAAAVGGHVVITSTQYGTGSTVTINSSGTTTATKTALGLGTLPASGLAGTGVAANLAAMTATEFNAMVTAQAASPLIETGDTTNPQLGVGTPGGSIQVQVSSTARIALGMPVAVQTGTLTTASYTSVGGDTAATVCSGLATAINALPSAFGGSAAAGTATVGGVPGVNVVQCTATGAGILTPVGALTPNTLEPTPLIQWLDNTVDPGIAADITAIDNADRVSSNPGWYAMLLDSQGSAEILAAAPVVQGLPHPAAFVYQTGDTECADGGSVTDVMFALKGLGYTRTYGLYQPSIAQNWQAAAWVGECLPTPPGQGIWGYAQLAGVNASNLTDNAIGNIVGDPSNTSGAYGKCGNVFIPVAGVNITQRGITAAGEWIDVLIFLDWLKVNLQADIFALNLAAAASGGKIPYTDQGIARIAATIRARLAIGIQVGGLAASPAPVVTVPTAASINAAIKASRVLPTITFTATLADAIQASAVTGSVTP